MKDEQPHIIAECAKCHFRFDILFGVDCPQCRTEAVREAFKPVDPLRTALGMGYEGMDYNHTEELRYDTEAHAYFRVDPELGNLIELHGVTNEEAVRNLDKVDVTPKDMPEGIRWHGPYYRQYAPAEQAEPLPEGCKMPKGKAAQVYELTRMRKLIGRL